MFENIDDLRKSNNLIVLYSTLTWYLILIFSVVFESTTDKMTNMYCFSYVLLLGTSYLSIYIAIKNIKLNKFVPLVTSIGYIIVYSFNMFTLNMELTWLYMLPFAVILVLLYRTISNIVITYIIFYIISCVELYNRFTILPKEKWGSLCIEQRMICILLMLVFLVFISSILNKYEKIVNNIYKESAIDQVSGLKSEEFIETRLAPMINSNTNITYTMVMINIDRFSQFNAIYGHILGDKILNRVGCIIKEELDDIKANINCCRLYGDKFIIVFTNRNFEEVSNYYKTIKHRLNTLIIRNEGNEIVISTTVSVTDTRLCEHTYISLYNRMRFLQDMIRQKGFNNLIEDSVEFYS